jgi:hypothetical protein
MEAAMPTKQPRLNVVLEPYLHKAIALMAKEEGISLSLKARDLLKEAIETHEDVTLNTWLRNGCVRSKARKPSLRPTCARD